MPDTTSKRLLVTKLQPPPVRARRVVRDRLLTALDEGTLRKLTLVSAPAGYGKSTLLAGWRARTPLAVAWLSLDEADNDPGRFLSYLVAALQRVDESLNDEDIPTDDPETVLTTVLNDLAYNDEELVLILDDLHLVGNPAIHGILSHLLEHAPPQLRLVVSTRSDPPIPLARLRARGELCELQAEDLRFRGSEVHAFLGEVMALQLAESDAGELERRTEGWPAGLQLAALSLQGRQDVSTFIERFTGTDRYVLDYLTEEVLLKQPDEVQNFLVLTSVLERLSGSLCDAVTGLRDSQARLEALERANLFIQAQGNQRQWYRYHPFFADLLRQRLTAARPDLVPDLHARASRWYEATGLPADAVRHALLAGNHGRAAMLLEAHPHAQAIRSALLEALHQPDQGEPLAALLEDAAQQGLPLEQRSRLIAVLEDGAGHATPPLGRPGERAPADALSERELEVLRLVGAGLSNKDIARRLDISLNTVKTHTKSIHGKLGARSRMEAVVRARELGLL